MKVLIILILCIVLVTFALGWMQHVMQGTMTTEQYFYFYCDDVKRLYNRAIDEIQKIISQAQKPIQRKQFSPEF